MSNKYYFDKEIAYPLNLVYRLGFEEIAIEEFDFLKELFNFLLLELNGRINGATYLLEEVKIGDKINMDLIEDEDRYIFEDMDEDEIIFSEECQTIAYQRLKALQTFRDSIDILYNMFYDKNIKDLENLVKERR